MECVSSDRGPSRGAGRPRRPALFGHAVLDTFEGRASDPARRIDAAHATASALIQHGRSAGEADPERTARLVRLADDHGLDEIAELWADRPADSLPGTLWRVYALRAGIQRAPEEIARAFDQGRRRAPVSEAVAGVAEPPGAAEVRALADAVLAGAFTGDLAVALERAAAFCRVVSTGWAVLAGDETDGADGEAAVRLTRRASDLARTAADLESAARAWRMGHLE